MALYSFLKKSVSGLMFVLLFPVVSLGQQSPYAGRQSREIKALSSDEIQGYLSGRGMGCAKAAELNYYPGPKHVLELADRLRLTEPQRTHTLDLYESMRQDAIRLGNRLVEAERRLDHLFATEAITEEKLEEVTREIARYQGNYGRCIAHANVPLQARVQLATPRIFSIDSNRLSKAGQHSIDGNPLDCAILAYAVYAVVSCECWHLLAGDPTLSINPLASAGEALFS